MASSRQSHDHEQQCLYSPYVFNLIHAGDKSQLAKKTTASSGSPPNQSKTCSIIFLQYGAGISKVIDCNKSIVGRVIGKGGETIKTMQKHFGANIQIDQQTEPMKITVSGQPAAVEAAAAAVQEIVNGGNPYLGGPGGGQGFGGGMPQSL